MQSAAEEFLFGGASVCFFSRPAQPRSMTFAENTPF